MDATVSAGIRRWAPRAVAGLFVVSGVAHIVRPKLFRPLMPKQLPATTELIYASGAAELVCAAGLLTEQPWAPKASAGLLLAVWPGNLTYAVKVTGKHGLMSAPALIGWARMPLQIPMIWAVLQTPPKAPSAG